MDASTVEKLLKVVREAQVLQKLETICKPYILCGGQLYRHAGQYWLMSEFLDGYETLDARISAGISQATPRLSEEGMARGLAAVKELLTDAATFLPVKTILVATSAVRDAVNGAEFRQQIFTETGYGVRLLSGNEEANLIGRGLTCDPALTGLNNFYLFDLGGGSLECLSFRDRTINQALSLQLGCVRLTERCVADAKMPFTAEAQLRVSELTREHFAKSGFAFDLPASAVTIGTGGITGITGVAANAATFAAGTTRRWDSRGDVAPDEHHGRL